MDPRAFLARSSHLYNNVWQISTTEHKIPIRYGMEISCAKMGACVVVELRLTVLLRIARTLGVENEAGRT